jgi:hypothetical protein
MEPLSRGRRETIKIFTAKAQRAQRQKIVNKILMLGEKPISPASLWQDVPDFLPYLSLRSLRLCG